MDTESAHRPGAAAVAAVGAGGVVALLDDEGVGYLVCDARGVSGETVVRMLDAGGGIFSVVLAAGRCAELRLPEQSGSGGAGARRIAASIDAREGTTTGISAEERANTARVAADPAARPSDLVVPGHVPPLVAADAGVFAHRGAEEAAFDLVRLAGGAGAAAICAILDEGGATAAPDRVRAEAAARGLPLTTVTEIAARRTADERPLRAIRRERLVTHFGTFDAVALLHGVTGETHLALVRGRVADRAEVPLAVRSSSPVEDLLASLRPSGEESLVRVLRRFERGESGILLDLRDRGAADPRAFDLAAAVLAELAPASILPLDPSLAEPLRERGIAVATPRNAPRRRQRGERCADFDYEVDTAI